MEGVDWLSNRNHTRRSLEASGSGSAWRPIRSLAQLRHHCQLRLRLRLRLKVTVKVKVRVRFRVRVCVRSRATFSLGLA